jgi:hypothetical protein
VEDITHQVKLSLCLIKHGILKAYKVVLISVLDKVNGYLLAQFALYSEPLELAG